MRHEIPVQVALDARHGALTASKTALKATPIAKCIDGKIFEIADGSLWRYSAAASAVDASENVVLTPDHAVGKFLRLCGAVSLVLPFTFATADAAVLFTTPAGARLNVREFFWTIAADMTGGAASAIGASSTKAGFTTKGDLLGGATGNVAAALTAALSPAMGAIGTEFDTLAKRRVLWKPAEIVRFDRITSAFTAGSGAVNVVVDLLDNAGA